MLSIKMRRSTVLFSSFNYFSVLRVHAWYKAPSTRKHSSFSAFHLFVQFVPFSGGILARMEHIAFVEFLVHIFAVKDWTSSLNLSRSSPVLGARTTTFKCGISIVVI